MDIWNEGRLQMS